MLASAADCGLRRISTSIERRSLPVALTSDPEVAPGGGCSVSRSMAHSRLTSSLDPKRELVSVAADFASCNDPSTCWLLGVPQGVSGGAA